MELNDFIVIGSSFCGAMVAKTLVENKAKVLLLDFGELPKEEIFSNQDNFISIREHDANQVDYFLGKNMESLQGLMHKKSVHLTPNRSFMRNGVESILENISETFFPIESLAKGGLGNGWGLGSFAYTKNELIEAGLPIQPMIEAYKWVSNYVAISGIEDCTNEIATGNYLKMQKPIDFDISCKRLFEAGVKHKNFLQKKRFYLGQTPLAVSTENEANGSKFKQNDLDFYSFSNQSGYRPIKTIHELEKSNLFTYKNNFLVVTFQKTENKYIQVKVYNQLTKETEFFYTKKLIFATGILGTSRIVMRSLKIDRLPLLCNPYSYIPSIQWRLLGKQNTDYQCGLSQISIYNDIDNNFSKIALGSVHSYRSLMGFRLINEFPIDTKTGVEFFKYIQPALNLTGVFHPEFGSEKKYLERIKNENAILGDTLKMNYELSENEKLQIKKTEKDYTNILKKLGAFPLLVKQNQHGSSIHYGGSIPYNNKNGLKLEPNGSLEGFPDVFVADASGFNYLSGKGLTLTLMAHAHVVAKNALKNE